MEELNFGIEGTESDKAEIYWHHRKPALLPCPFCGSEILLLENLTDADDFYVHCQSCKVQQIANYTRDEAIRRWNSRV